MLSGFKNFRNIFGNTFSTSRASGEFLLIKTDYGTVHVDGDIIRRIVERTRVEGVNEVKNVVINLPTENYPLQIRFNLIIRQNYSAPVIGANLRDAIKDELKNFLNIIDVKFDIRVTQINQNVLPEKKKRRVR
jgi:uncharacterized alkaline shock family protein YloU